MVLVNYILKRAIIIIGLLVLDAHFGWGITETLTDTLGQEWIVRELNNLQITIQNNG